MKKDKTKMDQPEPEPERKAGQDVQQPAYTANVWRIGSFQAEAIVIKVPAGFSHQDAAREARLLLIEGLTNGKIQVLSTDGKFVLSATVYAPGLAIAE